MGQNVNYLLGNQSQLMGADPELYRQQLIQQEQARIGAMPVQNQLGAQLGSLLGRGITNVAQDRGFFEVTNPVLQKLQKIQSVYDTSMQQADPNDPMSFYTTLQKNFADAGLGQQALMASVEAKKFETEGLKTEAARTEVYKNNLPLLNADSVKFREAGNNKKANELADMLGRFQVKEDRAAALQTADIALRGAQTKAQIAQADKLYKDVEEGKVTVTTVPDRFGGATIVFSDKNGNIIKEHKVQSPILSPEAPGGGATPPPAQPPGGPWKVVPTPVPGAK
jgi:hypothetical protein